MWHSCYALTLHYSKNYLYGVYYTMSLAANRATKAYDWWMHGILLWALKNNRSVGALECFLAASGFLVLIFEDSSLDFRNNA